MTLVVRPDLSKRTSLSKSALVQFDLCQTKAWYSIHDPKPFVPSEKTSFGSAVDAAVEKVIEAVRDGQTIDRSLARAAAAEVIERDEAGVDLDAVDHAVAQFVTSVVPEFDFSGAATQVHLDVSLEGLGPTDGHPDIILSSGAVWDVKTGNPKQTARTPELGLYALLAEATTGEPVPEVGYVYYNRKLVSPKWGTVREPVTDEFRRWAYERAAAFIRAKRADETLNRKAAVPQNFSFPGAAAFPSLCLDCPYAPANGGPCALAYREEVSDVA